MKDKIIEKNLVDQFTDDIKVYALYVNRVRMIPLIEDGLKFIHRRIIYSAYNDEKALSENSKVKSAAIVGTTIKTTHPHGDSSVYDAMKHLTNWFEIYMPLLVGQGNWGSFQGDESAAQRYTESYLSPFCVDAVIGELKENRNIIDWNETYDKRSVEPRAFPVKVPLLLINGSFGIGYGLKICIPPHNIDDVLDATINLIRNPNSEVVLIPEQSMPCDIVETNFKRISKTGTGKITVRGKIEILDDYKGRPALVIRSCPDLVFLNSVVKKINDLIASKKFTQIYSTEDDSNGDEMKYIIMLKKGVDPNYVRDLIYKNTPMQKTLSINFEVLHDANPVRLSYKSYLQSFIEFRKLTKFRLYQNKLQIVRTKYHQKDAFIKLLQSGQIDNIITLIRQRKTTDDTELIEYLIKTLNITDLQASYIINAKLNYLSLGYLNKYIEEAEECKRLDKIYFEKITNDNLILEEIIQELEEYKIKYHRPRRCKVIKKSDVNEIPQGDFKIVVTKNNNIKKIPINEGIGSFREDEPNFIIKGSNTENILLFDESGRVFKLPIHKIPISIKNSNGVDIRTIIKKLTSNISAMIYEPTLNELTQLKRKYFITVLTKNGNIKKLDIEDFLSVPPSGIIYIKLDPEDYVCDVTPIAHDLDIIVYSKNKALRMNLSEVPHQRRNTKGMRAITEPQVDGLSIIYPDTTDLITITESGYVNRSSIYSLPCMGRNKAGSKVIKLHAKDSIKCIFGLNENNGIKIITKNDRFEMPLSEIELGSSASVGKKLIPLKNDNIIKCQIIK